MHCAIQSLFDLLSSFAVGEAEILEHVAEYCGYVMHNYTVLQALLKSKGVYLWMCVFI